MVFIIVALFVLNIIVKSSACPVMGDLSCSPVSDFTVHSTVKDSNTKLHLAVNATLGDLLNNVDTYKFFNGNDLLYKEMPDSCNSSLVNGCNLTLPAIPLQGIPICSWNYTSDYNRNRIPQYLWHADCSHSLPPPGLRGTRDDCVGEPYYECTPVYYKIPVLMLDSNTQNCNPFSIQDAIWTWRLEEIPVSCACSLKCSDWNKMDNTLQNHSFTL